MTFPTSPDDGGNVAYAFTQTIDGHAEPSTDGGEVINPATAAPFARCPYASKDQLDRAVTAARRAFHDWSRLSFDERAEQIKRFTRGIKERADEIAQMITREQGKPLPAARAEVATAIEFMDETVAIKIGSEVLRERDGNHISLHYRPMGVAAGITPWNVPIVLASHKIVQALYTGNTLVLKPSPFTPLATLLLGEISRDTLPPGVLNVVAGGNELGQWITEHPGIDRVSFTGSTATGKRVMMSAAGTLKRVTLELGGNDPAIVLDDADLAKSLPKIFAGSFRLCGQVCMGIKRLYVPEAMYDKTCDTLATMAREHRVGDGFEPGVQMGPLQNKMQYDKVLSLLEDTKAVPGARIVAGGHTYNRPGYFLAPTVVADLPDDARLVTEEQFGPLLPVMPYKTVDEVVARANDTRMGLSASVWSENRERAADVASRIEAGTVWINHHVGADADIPFGGFKESGIGREHGLMGLLSYMEAQVVNVS